jgi:predicted RNase H-like HicB family nuclease
MTGKRHPRVSKEPIVPQYTAIIQRDGKWWIGWIEEIRGVNSQGRTRKELMENLQSALKEMLEMNRAEARAEVEGEYEEASVAV